MNAINPKEQQRQRRWRLLLGKDADGLGGLEGQDQRVDASLSSLYEVGFVPDKLSAGYGKSMPKAAKWLGEVKNLFPESAVKIIQKDAVKRLDISSLLQDQAFLEQVQPDIHLVSQLIMLQGYIPDSAKHNARRLVAALVEELLRKFRAPTEQSIRGAINRGARDRRPKANAINWNATIRANLKHYQPDINAIIIENLVGYARKRRRTKKIILCVDQSGSMAASVIYSSVFAAVLTALPTVDTRLVLFDTAIVDMSEMMTDPVDVLFGIQLGGGTDIAKAMRYCESLIESPSETHLILISDLCEGGDAKDLLKTAHRLITNGVNLVTLLALSDEGKPWYDKQMAANFTELGSPAFACSPDFFPDLMAAALERRDLHQFASEHGLSVAVGGEPD
ncbi:MAG: VWA domain-containing protein [Methylococcaceae bacterium]|nr:VWA domain-containing protein [Methylococcaceae bacterium]